jgi:hypothetical protein
METDSSMTGLEAKQLLTEVAGLEPGIVVDDIFELYTAFNFGYGAALGGVIAGMMVQARR